MISLKEVARRVRILLSHNERLRPGCLLVPPELPADPRNRRVQRGFPARILVEQRDRASKQPPHLIPKSGVLVAAGAVDAQPSA